jgi:hypothetical protein
MSRLVQNFLPQSQRQGPGARCALALNNPPQRGSSLILEHECSLPIRCLFAEELPIYVLRVVI